MIQLKSILIGYTKPLMSIPNISIEKGTLYALIGSNGSGKSTLLSTIIGITPTIAGEIKLHDKPIEKFNAKEIAKNIAFVNSKFDGIEHLTVFDYIALGRAPYTDTFGRLTKEDEQIINDVIELLNINDFKDRPTLKLSDGERQLVAIGRALAQTTPILLMDEPTSFLDYGNRKKIAQLLKKLSQEENKCILFSTHDIDLCLDLEIPVLVVNHSSKVLEELPEKSTKNQLTLIGFGV